jgi:hypothetical protein
MKSEATKQSSLKLLREMESTANRIRALIVSMPAQDLIGYIYAQFMMKAIVGQSASDENGETEILDDSFGEIQFLLEYVHAVLAADVVPEDVEFDEARCAELFELSQQLRKQAMSYAMASSVDTTTGVFGPNTADIEFQAKSNWVMIRGNRYLELVR